jgi:heme/copper-type cytochrome/quinol oxidase subunit 1
VYVVLSLLFGAGALVAFLLGNLHLVQADFLSQSASDTLLNASELAFVLLVAVPLFIGLATYVTPLQVGANTIAFPRAAALALWTWILSSGLFIIANCVDGGIGGGRDRAVDLGLLAVVGLVMALLLATVCVVTTVVTLRSPGMSLDRVPMFSWSMFVAGSVWMLTLPVLLANIVLIYVDHHYGRPSEFGVSSVQSLQIGWVISQPQIYAYAIPVFGIAADVIATLSGRRQPNRGAMLVAIAAFGALGVGAYAQPYFFPEVHDQIVWAGMGVLIIVPVLAILGGWAALLKDGRPALKSPLGLSLVSVVLVLLAVLAGALATISPLQLRDTPLVAVGQLALILAAVLSGGVAGVIYWAPKFTGRFAKEPVGLLCVLVLLGGGVLAGLPFVALGFSTKFTGLDSASDALQYVAVIGDALLALGAVLGLLALGSAMRGAGAAADAWGTGQTLEWMCSSPPAPADFSELVTVMSAEPLLDAAAGTQEA